MANITNNPLASLESYKAGTGSKYSFTKLTYPRRIENALSQGHYMNFYIYMHMSSAYLSSSSDTKTYSVPKKYKFGGADISSSGISFNETQDTTPKTSHQQDIGERFFRSHYKKITSAISLYVPDDSIAFTTKTEWTADSLTKAMGGTAMGVQAGMELINGIINAGKSALSDGGSISESLKTLSPAWEAAKAGAGVFGIQYLNSLMPGGEGKQSSTNEELIAGIIGYAINPQFLFMYKNLSFRRFSYRFLFTPNSEEEAQDVRNIIKMFRFHASPEVMGITGRFQIAPSVFEIEFMYKSSENQNIPKISTCVLEHINVDYSPRGWSTHTDGMPIHTALDLVFKEVELITKNRIEDGF